MAEHFASDGEYRSWRNALNHDLSQLIQRFDERKSLTLAAFVDVWRLWGGSELSFGSIHLARPEWLPTDVFMSTLFTEACQFLHSGGARCRTGAVYALFCLYQSQPEEPKVPVRATVADLSALRKLKTMVDKAALQCDIEAVVATLHRDKAIEVAAYSGHPGLAALGDAARFEEAGVYAVRHGPTLDTLQGADPVQYLTDTVHEPSLAAREFVVSGLEPLVQSHAAYAESRKRLEQLTGSAWREAGLHRAAVISITSKLQYDSGSTAELHREALAAVVAEDVEDAEDMEGTKDDEEAPSDGVSVPQRAVEAPPQPHPQPQPQPPRRISRRAPSPIQAASAVPTTAVALRRPRPRRSSRQQQLAVQPAEATVSSQADAVAVASAPQATVDDAGPAPSKTRRKHKKKKKKKTKKGTTAPREEALDAALAQDGALMAQLLAMSQDVE